jgi:hypothetical protein
LLFWIQMHIITKKKKAHHWTLSLASSGLWLQDLLSTLLLSSDIACMPKCYASLSPQAGNMFHLPNLVILTTQSEEYTLWNSSFCSHLHSIVIYSLLGLHILLCTFSLTPSTSRKLLLVNISPSHSGTLQQWRTKNQIIQIIVHSCTHICLLDFLRICWMLLEKMQQITIDFNAQIGRNKSSMNKWWLANVQCGHHYIRLYSHVP